MDPVSQPGSALGRRRFLGLTTASLAWVAAGCSGADVGQPAAETVPGAPGPSTDPTDDVPGAQGAPGALTAADFDALGVCVLIPEMVAGPFPTREQLERRDITEGYPGRPLRLGLRVVDEACVPVPDSFVEVWHTDASGDYSSYEDGGTGKDETRGSTFLRGTQTANGDGIVEFATIYPGWYSGRAVHIHVRVHRDGRLIRTSQLFLPDTDNEEVLATGAYAEFGPPDTTNATDRLGGDIANNGSLLHVTPAGTGGEPALRALLNLGVPTDEGTG